MSEEIMPKPSDLRPVMPEVTNPDTVKNVYSNNVGFGATATDIQLIFTHVRQGSAANGGLEPQNAVVAIVTVPTMQIPHIIQGLNAILESQKASAAAYREQLKQQGSDSATN